MAATKTPRIPLPKSWTKHVRSAMLHVISLAQYAAVYSRSWAVDSLNGRVRLRAETDRLREEVSKLREEMRIKDARMGSIPPQRRPHYAAVERPAILELRAARGWSTQQTAERFLVTAATIASWMKRVDEAGPNALVQLRAPVNKFPWWRESRETASTSKLSTTMGDDTCQSCVYSALRRGVVLDGAAQALRTRLVPPPLLLPDCQRTASDWLLVTGRNNVARPAIAKIEHRGTAQKSMDQDSYLIRKPLRTELCHGCDSRM